MDFYNWDYNTRKSCHYCQEYGHIPKNCIRTHFNGNYNRWLSQTTCFSCLKIDHINKHCPTRSKAPSCEFDKGKGKTNVEHIRQGRDEQDIEKERWMQHIKWRDHFT